MTAHHPASGAQELLIDRYLPAFDVTRREHLVIEAEPAEAWQALRDLDLMEVETPLTSAAMRARGLPGQLSAALGRSRPQPPPPPTLRLAETDVDLPGWLPLGEVPGVELAFGAVGRFWQPDIDWYDTTGMTPEAFAAFAEPGWGRIAASFSLRPYGASRTLASYEARTASPDPASALRFGRYWRLVSPFVSHIMRATLATLGRDAEARRS